MLEVCESIQCELIHSDSAFFSILRQYSSVCFSSRTIPFHFSESVNKLVTVSSIFTHVCLEFTEDILCFSDLFVKQTHKRHQFRSFFVLFRIEFINCMPLFILWLFKFYPNIELAVIYTRYGTKIVLVFVRLITKILFIIFYLCPIAIYTWGENVAHLFSRMTKHIDRHSNP